MRIFTHENGLLVAQTELAFEHVVSPRKARGWPSGWRSLMERTQFPSLLRELMLHAVEQLDIPRATTRARLSSATKTRSSQKLKKKSFLISKKENRKGTQLPPPRLTLILKPHGRW